MKLPLIGTLKLRGRLTLYVTLLAVTPLLLSTWVGVTTTQQMMQAQVHEMLRIEAEGLKDLVEASLVYRYEIEGLESDGLEGAEGSFSICSFWYIECLSRSGDLQKARFLFEKMLGYANHVGLYAEEIGPAGEHLGNYPQAFTHLALISAAYDLNRRLSQGGFES